MVQRQGASGRTPVTKPRAPRTGRAASTGSGRVLRPRSGQASLSGVVDAETMQGLLAQRAWARDLEPDRMTGVGAEVTMLRQTMRDAFLVGDAAAVRQCAEALRRLLRERAIVPEMNDADGEEGLEDGLSADLRRILHRVGLEMGVDA